MKTITKETILFTLAWAVFISSLFIYALMA